MGDGVLVEYASAVNALDCAVELQKSMIAAAAGKPEDRRRIAHDQPAIQASRSKRDGSVRGASKLVQSILCHSPGSRAASARKSGEM